MSEWIKLVIFILVCCVAMEFSFLQKYYVVVYMSEWIKLVTLILVFCVAMEFPFMQKYYVVA